MNDLAPRPKTLFKLNQPKWLRMPSKPNHPADCCRSQPRARPRRPRRQARRRRLRQLGERRRGLGQWSLGKSPINLFWQAGFYASIHTDFIRLPTSLSDLFFVTWNPCFICLGLPSAFKPTCCHWPIFRPATSLAPRAAHGAHGSSAATVTTAPPGKDVVPTGGAGPILGRG